jgi:acyl-CoA thioesterase FadM
VRYRFNVWKTGPRALAAVGEMVVVCVNLSGEKMHAIPIPDSWKAQLQPAAADLLETAD